LLPLSRALRPASRCYVHIRGCGVEVRSSPKSVPGGAPSDCVINTCSPVCESHLQPHRERLHAGGCPGMTGTRQGAAPATLRRHRPRGACSSPTSPRGPLLPAELIFALPGDQDGCSTPVILAMRLFGLHLPLTSEEAVSNFAKIDGSQRPVAISIPTRAAYGFPRRDDAVAARPLP